MHTPGPWKAVLGKKDAMADIFAPELGKDYRIAYVLRDSNPHQGPIDDANAKLIAAAPELKAVLKRLLEKVVRANTLQHSGGRVSKDDWGELYTLSNEARAVLAMTEIERAEAAQKGA